MQITAVNHDFLREPASLGCTILILTEGVKGMKREEIYKFYPELQVKFNDVLPEVDGHGMLRNAIERIILADMTIASTEFFQNRVGDVHMERLRVAKEYLMMVVRSQ